MKRLCMCVTVLTVCAFLVACVGCDSIFAVAKDKKNQLDKYLKDATVLPRANVQLEEAKKSRAKLKEIADKFNVDAEVALRQIKRLEEEQAKSKKAFEVLQDSAKQAGLPKRTEATPEDLQKTIQVGTKTLTGEAVYDTLKQFKAEVEKTGAAVAREKTKSDHLKRQSGGIKDAMSKIDANIDDLERKIEDYKMYQEMLAANKTIDALGLDEDMIKQLLNTDNIAAEIRKKVDEAEVGWEIKTTERTTGELKEVLSGGSGSTSITDDDLI